MKRFLLIIFFLLIGFTSCQNSEIVDLKNEIERLEKENLNLKSLIKKDKGNYLEESILFAIPEQKFYKLNQPGRATFSFIRYVIPSKYNLYHKVNGKKEYLVKDFSEPVYFHEFTPKSLKDTIFNYYAETIKGRDTITQPGTFTYDVIK